VKLVPCYISEEKFTIHKTLHNDHQKN